MHKIWRFYLQSFQRTLRGCKILKWITWPRPRLFQGWSVVRRLTLDIATTTENLTTVALAVAEIFQGVWNSTRGSAIAEDPHDALCQLKYYGRFLTELLTRSSANPESVIVSVCQSCTVFEILTLICQKLRRHVTLTTPTWGQLIIITRLTVLASSRA